VDNFSVLQRCVVLTLHIKTKTIVNKVQQNFFYMIKILILLSALKNAIN